jgi:hypothetical protein
MKPTIMIIGLLMVACGGVPESYDEACESDADCAGELSCETLEKGSIYYSFDTGEEEWVNDTYEACSMACTTDADCPDRGTICEGPDDCLDGICNPGSCA